MTRTRTKRMLQALAAAAAAVLVAGAAYAASTAQVPDYSWYRGHEADTSYQVNTPGKLRALANLVNGVADYDDDGAYDSPAVSFAGKTITQTGDIGLGGEEFVPIGSLDHPFEGAFAVGTDRFGNQRTVYGLSITKGSAYVGLFGYCGPASKIEGVHIVNSGSISRIALGTPAPATAFDGSAAADPRLGLGSVDVDANSVIHDVGSVVGYTAGAIASCESEAEVVVENVLQATNENPLVVANIGGMAGTVEGDVTDCRFAGDIEVTAPSLASDSNDAVVANVGGVVGTAGAANEDGRSARAGVVSGCSNGFADDSGRFDMGGVQSVIHVMTTGVGGLDRFGVQKEATSLSVGGIVGYGFGAIRDCSNYGMVNTNSVAATLYKDSSAAQAVHLVEPDDTRPAEYPEAQSLFKIANGGSAVGGIVGTLCDDGLGLAAQSRTDIGDSAGAIALTGCFDTGMVVGLARTGGIAGAVGSYADIDSCRNGKTDTASGSGVAADNGHVVTTRWNKPMTGGIAGTTYSNISNCANLAEIENIQTGYYTAGIVGGLYSPASYTSEVFACFNTGQVHVASYATQSYREAGLVGNNAGYLHDSVMRSGCVLSHDDGEAAYPNSAIGDDSWGAWSNVKFITASNLKKSESAAVLNASHAADVLTHPESEWVYWYIKGGYPTLNTWDAPADRAQLTSANVAASCVELAEFAGTVEAIPTLVVMFTDDKSEQVKLVQNVDFYAVPQEGAVAQTGDALNDTPYKATIVGIGNYEGWVSDACSYGIGPCDLKNCEVSTTTEKYNFGVPVYPEAVYVRNPAGALLDESDFRYEIYGGSTYTLTGANTGNYVVFDSAGFVSWDGGATRVPVADANARERLTSDLTGVGYTLYNADGERIYEVSDGGATRRTYDPVSGQKVNSSGPVAYKRAMEGVKGGGLAGYIVKVSAAAGTKNLKKSSWTSGQYVIEAIDLYRDAEIEQVTLDVPTDDGAGSTTRTWLWSNEKSTLYEPLRDAKGELVRDAQGKLQPALGADGNPVPARVTFTGGELHPKMTISFIKENGERVELVEDRANGYTLIYGDPYTTKQDLKYVNRDATPRVDGDGWAAGADATEDERKAADELAKQLAGHEKAAVTARSILGDKLTNYVHLYFPIDPAGLGECKLVLGGTDISADVAAGEGALLAEHDASKLPSFAYRDGYGVRPSIVVARCGNTLVEGEDYEVEFSNNVNKTTDDALLAYDESGDVGGLASFTVRGLGNVRGSYTGYFVIAGGKSLAAEGYCIEPIADQPYNLGYAVRPADGVHLAKVDPGTGQVMRDAQGVPVRADDMVEGRDYSVTYEDLNTSLNSAHDNCYGAKVFVRGINEYTGLLSTSFEAVPLDLTDPSNAWRLGPWQYRVATDENEAVPAIFAYTSLARKVYPIVNWDAYDPATGGGIDQDVYAWTAGPKKFVNRETGKVYTWDSTATATPESPLPGDYDATVDYSRGSYGADLCGTETFAVKLAKYDLAKFLGDSINPFRCEAQAYDGAAHEPVAGVREGWSIAYEDNVQAGTARFTVTAPDDDPYYTGTYVGSFEINPFDVGDADVKVADQLYTGKALTPAVRVSAGGVQFVEGRDYEVSYANNTSKGTATAVVRGIGSCEGRVDATFKIGNYLNIAQADFEPVLDQLFTGRAVKPALTATFDDGLGTGPVPLAEGVDYALAYADNVSVTSEKEPATITVTGKGKFANSKATVAFNIVTARNIADAACEIPDQAYTGEAVEPAPSVTYGGASLVAGTDYEVSYRRNVKAGADARAVITGKGTFTGTLSVPFSIVVKTDGSQAGDLAAAGIGTLARFGADAADAPAFALAVAEELYPGAVEGAVVAWKKDYAGQLLACSLARALDWPVLLANRDGVAGGVRTFVAEHGVSRAIVVGGEDAVSARAVTALESRGLSVERVAGADAAATSALVASRVAGAGTSDASGDVALANPGDVEGAAALAAWAAARGVPLLYTEGDGAVSDDVAGWLGDCTRLVIAGGYEKVDASASDRVSGACQVVRLAGADRYAESAAIARFAIADGSAADGALFANASSLSGQLAACALAAGRGVPIAVVSSGHLDAARAVAADSAVYRGVALGSDLQFSDTLRTSVAKELSW